jgi:hypothetical protein
MEYKTEQTPNNVSYETVLTFLSSAKRTLDKASRDETKLDGKLAYQREVQKFQDARHLLRANYFAFVDWCETGQYIAPERKTFPTCKTCGQITNKST